MYHKIWIEKKIQRYCLIYDFFFWKNIHFFQEAEVKADAPIADRVVEPDNNQLLEINLNHRRTQKFKKEMGGQLKSIDNQFWLRTKIISSISYDFSYYLPIIELGEIDQKGGNTDAIIPWSMGWVHSATSFFLWYIYIYHCWFELNDNLLLHNEIDNPIFQT